MGLASAIGGIFDQGDQQRANNASQAITDALKSGSPYWQAGQLTDDGHLLQGAAQLQNTHIGVNTGAFDADTAAYGDLGALYGGIAANGGALTQAIGAQAAADLANTNVASLRKGSEAQSQKVLAQDQAERNWAASGANQSRAQQLQAALQKQVWNTAVSHANFEASLAGKGLQNQDTNLAGQLALTMNEGAMGARNSQETLGRQQAAADFNNAMAALRGITAAAGGVSGTITDMNSASGLGGNAGTANSTGFTSGAQNYDSGYAVPTAALGTSFNAPSSVKLATQSKYVNPITGNTVDMNVPTDASAWGDWIVDGSSLASV